MKRASYRHAIETIALNDEPLEMYEDAVYGLASVLIISEIFGVDQERVARDVVRHRKAEQKAEQRATHREIDDGR